MPSRPNVLLIITDQQRGDSLACAGHPAVHTPNIDALARNGARFEHAFTCHPTCTPSRGSIFTGRYPSSHGARMTGMILPESERTLPQMLRENGYETALFGKAHFAPMGDYPDCPSREMRRLWADGHRPIEGDYYGFERVVFAGGHGHGVYGPYLDWLREKDAGAVERLKRGNVYRDLASGAPEDGYPDGFRDMFRFPLPAELHHSRYLAETASDYLREPHAKPFLAVVSFPDPHHPFCPPEEYAARYEPADMPAPIRRDSDDYRAWPPHFRAAFHGEIKRYSGGGGIDYSRTPNRVMLRARALTCGMVELIDDSVGRIIRTLDETGLRNDTVVIFTSDHGDLLGDHGLLYKGPFHWDGLIGVPFIWNLPGRFPPQEIDEGVGSTLDITPTVLDLCGVPQLVGVQGVSLRKCLFGQSPNPRREALTENDDDYAEERLRTLTTGEWKLTAYAGRHYGELYDRRNDPEERRNLWPDPAYREVRDGLRVELLDHVLRTQDRLPPQRWYA